MALLRGLGLRRAVTFHELSGRLTRIELNLDVVPTGLAERRSWRCDLADRRAEAELRRFKARLELINPDLYETRTKTSRPTRPSAVDDAEASDEDRRMRTTTNRTTRTQAA